MKRTCLKIVFGGCLIVLTGCQDDVSGPGPSDPENLDTTLPEVTITSANTVSEMPYLLTGTATDDVRVVAMSYVLDSNLARGILPIESPFSQELTLDEEGEYELTVLAEDAASNVGFAEITLFYGDFWPEGNVDSSSIGGHGIDFVNYELTPGNITGFVYQSGSVTSLIFDQNKTIIKDFTTLDYEQARGLQDINGNPALALSGSLNNLAISADTGSGFGSLQILNPGGVADTVKVPWGNGSEICALRLDKSMACYSSSGTGAASWSEDVGLGFSSTWIDTCGSTGAMRGLGISEGYALVATQNGEICHGEVDVVATASKAFDLTPGAGGAIKDLTCPYDAVWNAPVCMALESGAPHIGHIILWTDPTSAPTLVSEVNLGNVSNGVEGIIIDSGATACFTVASLTDDAIYEVCVSTTDGSVVSHREMTLTDCGGSYATYPNEQQIGVSCDGGYWIVNRADLSDVDEPLE